MKRVLVAIGLVVLVFGIMLSFYPPAFAAFGSITGLSSSKTIQDIHSGVVVKSNSFQDVPVVVTPNDNLSGSFQAGAPGVDFYLMDQGNYSVYRAGGGVFQYELAKLSVENYTFSFSNSASNQTVYLVFVSIPPATGNTDVLLNYKVIQDTSVSFASIIPTLIIVAGLVILVPGTMMSDRKKQPQAQAMQQAAVSQPTRPALPRCAFCGAEMPQGSVFCPSCKRSQV